MLARMSVRSLRNRIADEALRRAYSAMPDYDRSRYRFNGYAYKRFLIALLEAFSGPSVPDQTTDIGSVLRGWRVLDVGAGRGILVLAIRELGAEVVALERHAFDHSVTDMFREGNEEEILRIWHAHGVEPLIRDLNDLAAFVPAASFDAVVSMEVIEHLREPKRLVEGMVHAVKPGGHVFVATPNYGRFHARLRLLFGKNPKLDLEPFYRLGADGFVGHWREYLPDELAAMLRWGGLTNVRVTTFCDPWYPLSKGCSFYLLRQTFTHLASYLIPSARIELFAIARKPI
jgi:2-polyprenyl-3-methyl-5-hydroxy-6-metoxy-1,4-benzoquinol methylase